MKSVLEEIPNFLPETKENKVKNYKRAKKVFNNPAPIETKQERLYRNLVMFGSGFTAGAITIGVSIAALVSYHQ